MKKILSILETISLSTIITTNIIACIPKNKNNINNIPNKPIEPQFIPQQPPTNSNWKLIIDTRGEGNSGKTYIGIFGNKPRVNITDWKGIEGEGLWHLYQYKAIYRWDGVGKPLIPIIDKNTGKITNWNEKIEF